jgi:hypothetical protein
MLNTLLIVSVVSVSAASSLRSNAVVPPNIANLTLLTDAATQFGAVSLDGSPAAVYVRYEAETTKFYVHQQG